MSVSENQTVSSWGAGIYPLALPPSPRLLSYKASPLLQSSSQKKKILPPTAAPTFYTPCLPLMAQLLTQAMPGVLRHQGPAPMPTLTLHTSSSACHFKPLSPSTPLLFITFPHSFPSSKEVSSRISPHQISISFLSFTP